MQIRLATMADADAIAEIYNREVTEGTATFDMLPRTTAEQAAWMRDHSGAYPCIVAVPDTTDDTTTGDTVLGWACLSPYRTRPAYSTSVEDSIYVHRDHQGRGVGGLLLGNLVALADEHGFHAIFARIADAGAASVTLHAKHDFELIGVEREVGRKFGRWLDVTLMQRLRPA
ncbi:GNAT family N-acetyltransferase [Candidatus Poriferisodalis sp.]|uniref:GNAT family N-acetyltransferase n=1 Tax=Candidatus Poriferisodalis sp. TaxID=3101277 RepID=UPI003B52B125